MWTQVSFTTGVCLVSGVFVRKQVFPHGSAQLPKTQRKHMKHWRWPKCWTPQHHLNELWHYSQFFMWRAFVLLCEMLACCGFVCWKNTFHLVCLKIHCDSFKVIIIHSPASEDTNRGADSSNYMFIMDQSSHRHIPHRAVYSHDSTILFQGLFGDSLAVCFEHHSSVFMDWLKGHVHIRRNYL